MDEAHGLFYKRRTPHQQNVNYCVYFVDVGVWWRDDKSEIGLRGFYYTLHLIIII